MIPKPNNNQPQKYRSTLIIQHQGCQQNILLIALNRPQTKNAFNNTLYKDLIHLLNDVEKDDSIDVIVLTGMGDYFSSGADLSDFDDNDDDDGDKKEGTIHKPSGQFMMKILSFPKLICCAINGPTIGIGVTLLPHVDLSYCTYTSTFWTPFNRIALVPEFASSITFVECMGLQHANEMLLLGEKIDAKKAIEYNLCMKIIYDCNEDCVDAFAKDSIGMKVCQEIDEKLLSLPSSEHTSRVSTRTVVLV